jgi:hypothetical protein
MSKPEVYELLKLKEYDEDEGSLTAMEPGECGEDEYVYDTVVSVMDYDDMHKVLEDTAAVLEERNGNLAAVICNKLVELGVIHPKQEE